MSAAASAAGAAAAGLVPFKTSLLLLDRRSVSSRRVARLKRSVWASGHLHAIAETGFRPSVAWMVTLTFARPDEWKPDQVSMAVQRFRNWCRKSGVACRYTWVAEIQPKRLERTGQAVVHYHVVAWLPVGVRMPHWDQRVGRRAALWPHGMSRSEQCKTGVGYLMKYLSKLGELTVFPKGLRLYGIGGLNEAGKHTRRWFNLPTWARAAYGVGELCRTACGLVVRDSGEILAPVWRLLRVPGGFELQKLRDVPPRFPELAAIGQYPGAFSSWGVAC